MFLELQQIGLVSVGCAAAPNGTAALSNEEGARTWIVRPTDRWHLHLRQHWSTFICGVDSRLLTLNRCPVSSSQSYCGSYAPPSQYIRPSANVGSDTYSTPRKDSAQHSEIESSSSPERFPEYSDNDAPETLAPDGSGPATVPHGGCDK